MTCDDARERFSDLIDDRLDAGERVGLDAHLGGCAACRHELDRFRATVALVRSLAPARAPVGFVDRVTAAAAPRPWWRRAFLPLPVKLPIQAAAILLVGVGVVYVFQRTPELQQAAREERGIVDAPPTAAEAPATKPGTPTAVHDAATEGLRAGGRAPAAPEERPPAAQETAPPASPPVAPPAAAELRAEMGEGGEAEARASGDAAAAKRAREEPFPSAAGRPAARTRAVDVTITRKVDSRPAAQNAVRDLVIRHRGTIDATRAEPDATIVEARIPRDEWAGFAAGLAGVGRGETPRETAATAEVRVTIRLE